MARIIFPFTRLVGFDLNDDDVIEGRHVVHVDRGVAMVFQANAAPGLAGAGEEWFRSNRWAGFSGSQVQNQMPLFLK